MTDIDEVIALNSDTSSGFNAEFPAPVSYEEQCHFGQDELMRYLMAMSTRVSAYNPLVLSVVDDAKSSHKPLGIVHGGFAMSKGQMDVLGVLVPGVMFVLTSLITHAEDAQEYTKKILSEGDDISATVYPQLKGRKIMLYTNDVAVYMGEVTDAGVGNGMGVDGYALFGPIEFIVREFSAVDTGALKNNSPRDWVSLSEALFKAPARIDNGDEDSADGSSSTPKESAILIAKR